MVQVSARTRFGAVLPSLGRLLLLLVVEALWLTPAGGPLLPLPGFGRDGLSQEALAAAFAAQEEVSRTCWGFRAWWGPRSGWAPCDRPVVMVYLEYAAVDGLPASFAGYPLVRAVTGRITALGDLPLPPLPPAPSIPGARSRARCHRRVHGRTGVTAGTSGARGYGRAPDLRPVQQPRLRQPQRGQPGRQRDPAGGGRWRKRPGACLRHAGRLRGDRLLPRPGLPRGTTSTAPSPKRRPTIWRRPPLQRLRRSADRNGRGIASCSRLQKYGRTTGTRAEGDRHQRILDVNYRTGRARFVDQIVITGQGFSAGGDSCSLIVTEGRGRKDRRPVGLLFAGSPNTTIANPIDLVLDRFGVTVDPG